MSVFFTIKPFLLFEYVFRAKYEKLTTRAFPFGESKTILNCALKVGHTRSEKIDFNRQA